MRNSKTLSSFLRAAGCWPLWSAVANSVQNYRLLPGIVLEIRSARSVGLFSGVSLGSPHSCLSTWRLFATVWGDIEWLDDALSDEFWKIAHRQLSSLTMAENTTAGEAVLLTLYQHSRRDSRCLRCKLQGGAYKRVPILFEAVHVNSFASSISFRDYLAVVITHRAGFVLQPL